MDEGEPEGGEEEKEGGKEEGGGGSGGGVKEEDPGEDIEEVKAETVEVAVEDAGSGGVLVIPWLSGEAGHAWGLSHAYHDSAMC